MRNVSPLRSPSGLLLSIAKTDLDAAITGFDADDVLKLKYVGSKGIRQSKSLSVDFDFRVYGTSPSQQRWKEDAGYYQKWEITDHSYRTKEQRRRHC